MRLIELTSDYEMKPFDCGDAALNDIMANNKWFMWRKLWQAGGTGYKVFKKLPCFRGAPRRGEGLFLF